MTKTLYIHNSNCCDHHVQTCLFTASYIIILYNLSLFITRKTIIIHKMCDIIIYYAIIMVHVIQIHFKQQYVTYATLTILLLSLCNPSYQSEFPGLHYSSHMSYEQGQWDHLVMRQTYCKMSAMCCVIVFSQVYSHYITNSVHLLDSTPPKNCIHTAIRSEVMEIIFSTS